MTFQNGEVTISPYIINWIQMPVIISENDKIELLKSDLLIIDCNVQISDFAKLFERKGEKTAFFFNLDRILNSVNKSETIEICVKLAKIISKLDPAKTIIHTSFINEAIKNVFQKEGLIYIEKNFNDKEGAVTIIKNLIKPIFSYENNVKRAFVRITIYPINKYKVEITTPSNQTINGILKDISLNGIGIILTDKKDIDKINLKDTLYLKIITQSAILKIPISVVARKSPENLEIGVVYDINNPAMIKDETSLFISKIIYKYLTDIVKQFGKIDESAK